MGLGHFDNHLDFKRSDFYLYQALLKTVVLILKLVKALRVVHSQNLDSTLLPITLHGASFWEWPTLRVLDYS